eukprot:Tbor_TRINITY_DN5495_c1_g2::TRINITY_DN5495_c1_g2_i1::g.24262::m.24262
MMLYGLEYCIIPCLGLPYFIIIAGFDLPIAFVNNAVVTAACGISAYYHSWRVSKAIGIRNYKDRLEPVWTGYISLLLAYITVLHIIFCVTHLSYYRTGPLLPDLFDR